MPLSASEIAATAKAGGFAGQDVPIAVAVALAESGGNPNAHNTKPPDDSYGLWQINMYGELGPKRLKAFGLATKEQLFDPLTNAHAAVAVKSGSGWGAWSTYKSGAYLKHLPAANAADSSGAVPAGIASPTGTTGDKDTSGIRELSNLLGNPGTWWRVAFIVGGCVMLGVGTWAVMKRTGFVKKVSG